MVPASSSSSRSSLARAVGGQDPHAGVAQPATASLDGHADGDGQVEQRTDRGADRLGVVEVDGGVGEHDRVGAGGVGAAQHGAGVARVAYVGEDGDELGRAARISSKGGQEAADADEALRGDGLRDVGEHRRRRRGARGRRRPGRRSTMSAYRSAASAVAKSSTSVGSPRAAVRASRTACGPSARNGAPCRGSCAWPAAGRRRRAADRGEISSGVPMAAGALSASLLVADVRSRHGPAPGAEPVPATHRTRRRRAPAGPAGTSAELACIRRPSAR